MRPSRLAEFVRSGPYLALILAWHSYRCAPFLLAYLDALLIGGADGEAHYALARVYSERIFPHPFGWTQSWNAGMPWPVGYPPFFHYLLALLARVFMVDFLDLFQGFVAVLFLLFPWTFFFAARSLGTSRAVAAFTAVAGSLFLCSPQVHGGIGVSSTFTAGLYPQFVAAFVFVIWIGFLVRDDSAGSRTVSTLLLAVLLLTNVHVAESAFLTLAVFALIDGVRCYWSTWWRKYLLHTGLSFALAAFWLVPLLSVLHLFPHKTLPSLASGQLVSSPFLASIAALGFLGGALALRNGQARPACLMASAALIFGLVTLPLAGWLPELPLQPGRFLPIAFVLLILLAGVLFENMRNAVHMPPSGVWFIMSVWIVFGAMLEPRLDETIWVALLDSDSEKLAHDLGELGNGRSTIEVWNFAFPVHYTIAARVGLAPEHRTLWNVFRESTINSPFLAPLRNSFSADHESFGVPCHLCEPKADFYRVGLAERLDRARWYDVRYFALRSPTMIGEFLDSDEVSLRARSGDWLVFELNDDPGFVEESEYEPAVVFTKMEMRSRSKSGPEAYDWLHLGEEWLSTGDPKVILALAQDLRLDRSPDLKRFRTAVVLDYSYADEEVAYRRLRRWVADGNVLVLFEPDAGSPLFSRLAAGVQDRNIVVLARTGSIAADFRGLSRVLRRRAVPQRAGQVHGLHFGDRVIRFTAETRDVSANSPRAFYVKMSYFPWWQPTGGGFVYMASPANTLILSPHDAVELHFVLPIEVWVGAAISLCAAVALGFAQACQRGMACSWTCPP